MRPLQQLHLTFDQGVRMNAIGKGIHPTPRSVANRLGRCRSIESVLVLHRSAGCVLGEIGVGRTSAVADGRVCIRVRTVRSRLVYECRI